MAKGSDVAPWSMFCFGASAKHWLWGITMYSAKLPSICPGQPKKRLLRQVCGLFAKH